MQKCTQQLLNLTREIQEMRVSVTLLLTAVEILTMSSCAEGKLAIVTGANKGKSC